MLAIRSATVVFPVPGLPVKLMCSVGRWELRPISSRSRSITSSAAISRIRRFTGAIAIRSRSISSSTACTREVAAVPVPMPDRILGCVGMDCVTHLAIGLVLALEAEPGLLGRAVHDEAEPRRLAPERAVVADQLHVVVGIRLAARLDVAH